MSVYIPGMEMPESCYGCPCNKDDGFGFFTCGVTKSECDFISLPSNCPLVHVPEHGRLIDADALIDAIIAKYIRHERNRELVFAAAEIKQDLADIISELPTIIPANKEGEG